MFYISVGGGSFNQQGHMGIEGPSLLPTQSQSKWRLYKVYKLFIHTINVLNSSAIHSLYNNVKGMRKIHCAVLRIHASKPTDYVILFGTALLVIHRMPFLLGLYFCNLLDLD